MSYNKNNEKYKALKQLFPEVINADGQLNIEALKDVIDIAQTTANNKGYELTFAGKGLAKAKASSETAYELKAQTEQSKDFDTSQNVVIRGDNLEVLKILKANYFEKIKMIYIDPPYNTKSDNFIYSDNFEKKQQELIESFGLDENTKDFLANVYGTQSHSGWLAFIYPRLKLARDLLRDDGVLFISIDDNEQANLKLLCDEIFGEDNFVGIFKWNKTSTPPSLSNKIRGKYEFVFCYEKQISNNVFNGGFTEGGDMPLLNEGNAINTLIIPKEKVKFNFSGEFTNKLYDRVELLEKLNIKNGYANKDIKIRGRFKWSQETVNKEILEETNFIIKTDKFAIRYIRAGERIKKPADIISKKECNVGTNEDANKEQKIIFDNVIFNNPKPTSLIKYLTNFICTKNDLILDFFAGSGTTGDAVMQLNNEDGGTRKFILVQWDEAIKEHSEAYRFCSENNLKPVISSITIERLHRAGAKLKQEQKTKEGMFESENLDIGYKVFSLTPKPKLTEGANNVFVLENQRNNNTDTVYNMLCATGKPLHTPVQERIKGSLYLVEHVEKGITQKSFYVLDMPNEEIAKQIIAELDNNPDSPIYIDGYSSIKLQNWLNLGIESKESIKVVY